MNRVAQTMISAKNKVMMTGYMISLMMTPVVSQVLADGTDYKTQTSNILSKILGIVANVFLFIGIFFLVLSIFNLISALKQEDAERQTRQITNIVISAVMIGMKAVITIILNQVNSGSGLHVTVDDAINVTRFIETTIARTHLF